MKTRVNFDVIKGKVFVNWRYGYKVKESGGLKYKPLKFSTGIQLDKSQWDSGLKRVSKGTDKSKSNLKLNQLELDILRIVDDFKLKKIIPPPEQIIEKLFAKQEVTTKTRLLEFIREYLEGPTDLRNSTLDQYRYFANNIERYDAANKPLFIEDIDDEKLVYVIKWMEENGSHGKLISENTIGKFKKNMKVFLRIAERKGVVVRVQFKDKRLRIKRIEADHVSLTKERLLELARFDLIKSGHAHLQLTKDLFVISCFTGLRISDWGRMGEVLQEKSGKKMFRYIRVRMQKTDDLVEIPINQIVFEIYQRHGNKFPKPIVDQFYNRRIKELGQIMGWSEIIEKREVKGGKNVFFKTPFYDMLSSHTGRRTFCTNSFLAGIPANTIMKISGHKDTKSFYTYISNRNMMEMKDHYHAMNKYFGF